MDLITQSKCFRGWEIKIFRGNWCIGRILDIRMKEYTIYLELFGKKMKVSRKAASAEAAKEKVKNEIIFHKIVEPESDFISGSINDFMDFINKIK